MDKENLTQEELVQAIDYYYDKPVEFAEDLLGFIADPQQAIVMNSVAQNRLTSVRAGHGVGKSALTANIVIWFLTTRPFPKIPCTAPKESQLFDILWAEISKWLRDSPLDGIIQLTQTRLYMDGYKEEWFAVPRTSNQPENLAGFHADDMLYVVDEASGVPDENFEVIMGALSGEDNKMLCIGNPTKTSGFFFDSHNKDRSLFSALHIDAEKSQRVSKQTIDFFKKKYGPDSNAYKIRVKGDFPDGEDDAFISLHDALLTVGADYENTSSEIEIGVDVARFGDDETVIATRIGMEVQPLEIYNRKDTMETTGYVLKAAKELIKRFSKGITVKIDDTGLGGGVTDRLKEVIKEESLNIKVLPINFASKGNDEYDGIVSQMYGHFKDECLKQCILPDDEVLIAQLSTRRYQITSSGKIKLESKKEMKRRGLDSPDRAEAIVMAFWKPPFEVDDLKVPLPLVRGRRTRRK